MSFDSQPAISVLQLQIILQGLSPPVWRRVLVPEHLTLTQLRNVIQVVMGWAGEHLHQFSIRGRHYGEAHEDDSQFSTVANELPLTAFRLREHEGFVYVHDFNAWWRHEIRRLGASWKRARQRRLAFGGRRSNRSIPAYY
ncbi:plasmid pRiA4b ORF-3 family protein [Cupriavidus basilensis]|uniref:plasmid pRiA4b ORF-3 family protein n=1 Tax=Cupriavidus basilensis TaxID=68895 RepID=UPI003D34D123